jgi:hypothetical protein
MKKASKNGGYRTARGRAVARDTFLTVLQIVVDELTNELLMVADAPLPDRAAKLETIARLSHKLTARFTEAAGSL